MTAIEEPNRDAYESLANKWIFAISAAGYVMSLIMVLIVNIRDLKAGFLLIALFLAGVAALPFFALSVLAYLLFQKSIKRYTDDKIFKADMYVLKTSFIGTVIGWLLFYSYVFIYNVPGEYFIVPFVPLIPLIGGGIGFMAGLVILEHMA